MDQEGENVEKPDEHQNQEGGEETKPDADMEIDQLFLNNGLRALYLCSDKLFFLIVRVKSPQTIIDSLIKAERNGESFCFFPTLKNAVSI